MPPPQQPLRSPGSHNLQMPYGIQKAQTPAPYLQQQQQNQLFPQQNAIPPNLRQPTTAPQMSPAPPYQQHPNYNQDHHIGAPVPNDILMSNIVRNSAQQVVQQQKLQNAYPPLDAQQRHLDSKDYQFLQNVHFPEKLAQATNPNVAMLHAQQHMTQQQQQQQLHHGQSQGGHMTNTLANLHSNYNTAGAGYTNEFSSLLPSNMSFYDMALEPKDNQMKWFVRLMETQGIEAANKFTEILRQVPTLATSGVMNHHQMPPKAESNELELDNIFDNLPQPLLKDILGLSTTSSNAGSSSSGVSSGQMLGNGIMGSHSSKSSIDSELIGSKDSHQSIPLYRRQAGQSYSSSIASSASTKNHSIASSTPDMLENNFFESIEKLSQNFTSSLFNQPFNEHNGFQAGLPPLQQLLNQANQVQSQQLHQQQLQSRLQTAYNMHQKQQQQQQQQQVMSQNMSHQMSANQPPPRTNESVEEMLNRHNATTYASVLSGAGNVGGGSGKQQLQQNHGKDDSDKDPFTANLCASRKSNGFYNYFQ